MNQSKVQPVNIFVPLEWQIEPWKDKSPILLLTGSAGGGKSTLGAEKVHAYCLRYPGSTALVLRKIRQSMTNSTVLFLDRMVIGSDPRVHHYPSKNRFEYNNGSVLAYGGMANEEQREQIRSIGAAGGVDIAWMEEATGFKEDDFNEILARMRGTAANWQQILLSTNPGAPSHFINQRLILGGEAAVYYSSADQNTHNSAQYKDALNKLTGVLAERLREGKWTQAEGAIYTDWREEVHLIDPSQVPECSRYICGIDWGFTNAGVMQVWAIDGDGRMYLVAQQYRTRMLVDWWIEQGKSFHQKYNIEAFVCDPAQAEYIEQFRQAGLNAVKANNAVIPGINAVQQRLTIQPDGKPRLYIVQGSVIDIDHNLVNARQPYSTEHEITSYTWSNSKTKEQPTKDNDHGMDAMRYTVMYLDHGFNTVVSMVQLPW
jgi:phage terminase large subunit